MRDNVFDIAYEQIGMLGPIGVVRLPIASGTKTTKTP
jgi:hypothetical protein